MFMGEYNHTLDTKGRLIIPTKFRDGLGEEFKVTRGLDGCLFAFPLGEWEKFEEQLRSLPEEYYEEISQYVEYLMFRQEKRKKTNPSAEKIMDICYALDVTPEQLLTGVGIDDANETPPVSDRIHIDKVVHLILIPRRNNYQIISMILHHLKQSIDRFLTIIVRAARS